MTFGVLFVERGALSKNVTVLASVQELSETTTSGKKDQNIQKAATTGKVIYICICASVSVRKHMCERVCMYVCVYVVCVCVWIYLF